MITLRALILSDQQIINFFVHLVIDSDVDIENVALDQRPAVRDAVCRHVINRARDTLGETLERKWRLLVKLHCILFTSKFRSDGYELCSIMRSRASMSNEKLNKTLEEYFDCFYQSNWNFMRI